MVKCDVISALTIAWLILDHCKYVYRTGLKDLKDVAFKLEKARLPTPRRKRKAEKNKQKFS